MPPKNRFTRSEIVGAAVDVVRVRGAEALTARAVAAALDASTKVIFGLFDNMDALRMAVIHDANARYHAFLSHDMAMGEYPPYKAAGMAYIRFAQEETQLFRLLFMRDRSHEPPTPDTDLDLIAAEIMRANGCTREQAELIHLEMWVCVHGIASLQATAFQSLPTELVSRILTDTYRGVCGQIMGG